MLKTEISFETRENDEQIDLGSCWIAEPPSCLEGAWDGSSEKTFLKDLCKLERSKFYLLRKGTNQGKDEAGVVHAGLGHWQVLYFNEDENVWRFSSQNPNLDPALTQVTEPGYPPTQLADGGRVQLLGRKGPWGKQAGQNQYLVFEMNERLIKLALNYVCRVRQFESAEDGISLAMEEAFTQAQNPTIELIEGIISIPKVVIVHPPEPPDDVRSVTHDKNDSNHSNTANQQQNINTGVFGKLHERFTRLTDAIKMLFSNFYHWIINVFSSAPSTSPLDETKSAQTDSDETVSDLPASQDEDPAPPVRPSLFKHKDPIDKSAVLSKKLGR